MATLASLQGGPGGSWPIVSGAAEGTLGRTVTRSCGEGEGSSEGQRPPLRQCASVSSKPRPAALFSPLAKFDPTGCVIAMCNRKWMYTKECTSTTKVPEEPAVPGIPPTFQRLD